MSNSLKYFKGLLTILCCASIGLGFGQESTGGSYDEVDEKKAADLELTFEAAEAAWDINDSLQAIPFYDDYCMWDTKTIHGYEYDLTKMKDTVDLVLRYDSCDYSTPWLGRITSPFGERGARYHYGIDVKLYKGDPVKSAFEGMVRISKYSRSYGNVVVVRHQNGLETLYAHLSARKVKSGDYVQSGDVIGLGGNTGRSTGSHLHFECRYKGEPIHPEDVIDWQTGALKHDVLKLNQEHFAYLKEARAKKYHRIRSGDTLSAIARRYGTSVGTLCRLNGISSNKILRIGQSIRYR
ncbi:peptidoglycan DD-metalloendopeptidase family protein [Halocola ammonii]